MKNRIHLNAAFGLILLGVGGIVSFIAGVSIYENTVYRYAYGTDPEFYHGSFWGLIWTWEEMYFFVLGNLHVLVGGGLMARAKWSHWAAKAIGIAGFLGWSYLVYHNFEFHRSDGDFFWVEVGFCILIYGLLISGALFLGNEKVKKELNESDEEFWDSEILDA